MVENDREDDRKNDLETSGGKVVDPREYDLDLDEQDVDEIRDFVDRAESGDLGPMNQGLEAMVRVAELIIEDHEDEGSA